MDSLDFQAYLGAINIPEDKPIDPHFVRAPRRAHAKRARKPILCAKRMKVLRKALLKF
jgi:hypothetical protein